MKKSVLLFFIICLPCFAYSQQWQQYSDSVLYIVQRKFDKKELERAFKYIQFADLDIEKNSPTKDTVYADYLYRKGYVLYNIGQFKNEFFDEALSIWDKSNKKNQMKIMKNHYFLGAGYHLKLDYDNAYKNYEICFLINKKYNFPSNYYFTNATYFLSVMNYNTFKNYNKAKKYAEEYIRNNQQNAFVNYDFNYAYSYNWMNDLKGFENVLLNFEKNYQENKQQNLQLLFRINYELFTVYYKFKNINQIIKYGEKAIEIQKLLQINDLKILSELYSKLVWAYAEINDSINLQKYRELSQKHFLINNEADYLLDLDRLDNSKDYINFKIKFEEYEALYKNNKKYNLLFYMYAYYLLNLYERDINFKREDVTRRIDYVELIYEHLSNEERIDFDLFKAEFYKVDKQYQKALDISSKNSKIIETKRKLSFYKIKSWCQYYLGDIRNARLTALEAYEIGNKEYSYNNPKILPLINNVLDFNYLINDQTSAKISVHALRLLYENNLAETYIAIRTWTLLGNYYLFNGNYSDAKKYFEKSLNIQEKNEYVQDKSDYILCLSNLGFLKSKELDFDGYFLYLNRIKQFLDKNLSMDNSYYGDYYNSLGDYYMCKLQFQEAIINYEKSFAILGYNESKKHNFNYIICDFFIKKDINKTINELELFQKNNDKINHVSNLIYLLKFNSGSIDSAQNYLVNQLNELITNNNKYFHFLNSYEKEILFRNFKDQFEFLNTYLLTNNHSFIKQYINFRFYSKSLLFSRSLNYNIDSENNVALYSEFKDITIQINSAIESKIIDLKSIELLKSRNREIEKLISANANPVAIPTLKDLDNKIKLKEAYVEIVRINKQSKNNIKNGIDILEKFTDSIYYGAIIIKKNTTPKFIIIDDSNKLEKEYASSFKSKILNKKENNESYHLLFEKIDNELKDVKKIYLVTDGVYNSINIESIYNPNTKQYLIDYLKIQPIQNVRAITDDKKDFKVSMNTKTILFGNPDFDLLITDAKIDNFLLDRGLDNNVLNEIKSRVKIGRLNGTQKEIETLDAIFKNSKSTVELFSKANATEDNLKKIQSPDILHIATHGYFLSNDDTSKTKQSIANLVNDNYKNDSYLKSGLLLAGAQNTLNGKQPENSNNGILTAEEVKSLNLKDTELVVLSACETGLGDNLVGEGVIGLQRAFMIAGAKSVIMSLWSVSDQKTQELMTLFYTNWIKNNMSKEEALYQAKIEMKKIYPEPYYWAGFVLLE